MLHDTRLLSVRRAIIMERSVRILPRLTRYEDTRSEFSEASGMESDNFPPSLPPFLSDSSGYLHVEWSRRSSDMSGVIRRYLPWLLSRSVAPALLIHASHMPCGKQCLKSSCVVVVVSFRNGIVGVEHVRQYIHLLIQRLEIAMPPASPFTAMVQPQSNLGTAALRVMMAR